MATVKPRQVQFLSDEERETMIFERRVYLIPNDRVLAMDTEITRLRGALDQVMYELGVPNSGYPAPVANAWNIAKRALNVGLEYG